MRLALLCAVLLADLAHAEVRSQPKPAAPARRPFRNQFESELDREARAYERRGAYARAEAKLRALLAVKMRRGTLRADVADVQRRLGLIRYARADYAAAEAFFRAALRARDAADPAHRPDALRDLASLAQARGEPARAARLFRRVLELREKDGEDLRLAAALGDLGALHCDEREYAKARGFLERALTLREKLGAPADAAHASLLSNLALAARGAGDDARAEALLGRARALLEAATPRDELSLAYVFSNLALARHARGDFEAAEALFREALAAREKALDPGHPAIAASLVNVAWMQVARGLAGAALPLAARALEVRERHLQLVVAGGSEAQRQAYLAMIASEKDFAVSLLRAAPGEGAAARLAARTVLRRKGRVLDALAGGIGRLRSRLDAEGAALLAQLTEARAELAALVTRRTAGSETGEAAERMRALERALGERSAAFRGMEAPITVARVQSRIAEDAALVEVVWYRPLDARAREAERWRRPHYAAFVLRRTGEPAWIDLGAAEEIDVAVRRLRQALHPAPAPKPAEFVAARARHLAAKVWLPIVRALAGVRVVLWSPDGALNLVPLALLPDEAGRPAIDRFVFTSISSGRDLLRDEEAPRPRQGPVLVVSPEFGGGEGVASAAGDGSRGRRSADLGARRYAPLPGSRAEGEAVEKLLPGAALLAGAQATEAALKAVHGPVVLHVASHGFFLGDAAHVAEPLGASLAHAAEPRAPQEENPLLRAGLVLAGANALASGDQDGVLTALEMAGLDLWGTELVVLSACETGLGEVRNGEGVFGLRRALVLAGARSQVLSLWKVDDAATKRLMVAYYERLRAGVERAAALREAQQVVRAEAAWSHPYYWAGFVPSGEMGPIPWAR